MAVPHGMELSNQIAVMVGHVHCNLNSGQIALALGYRPGSGDLYYTAQQVREIYDYFKTIAPTPQRYNVYYLWGPMWDMHGGQYRVSEATMMFEKRLVMEALRRGEVNAQFQRRRQEEYDTRKRTWYSINIERLQRPGGQWDAFDEANLVWDGLVDRRSTLDGLHSQQRA